MGAATRPQRDLFGIRAAVSRLWLSLPQHKNIFWDLSLPRRIDPVCQDLGLSRLETLEAVLRLEVGFARHMTESDWIYRVSQAFEWDSVPVRILRDYLRGTIPSPDLQKALFEQLADVEGWDKQPYVRLSVEGFHSSIRVLLGHRDPAEVSSKLVQNGALQSARYFGFWRAEEAGEKNIATLRDLIKSYERVHPLRPMGRSIHLETRLDPTSGFWTEREDHYAHPYEVPPLLEMLGGKPPHVDHCGLDALRLARWLLDEGYSDIDVLQIRARDGVLHHHASIWGGEFEQEVSYSGEGGHVVVVMDDHVLDPHSLLWGQPLPLEDYFARSYEGQDLTLRRFRPNDYRGHLKLGGRYAAYSENDYERIPELKDDLRAAASGSHETRPFIPIALPPLPMLELPLHFHAVVVEALGDAAKRRPQEREMMLDILYDALAADPEGRNLLSLLASATDVPPVFLEQPALQRQIAKALWQSRLHKDDRRGVYARWQSYVSRLSSVLTAFSVANVLATQRGLWSSYREVTLPAQIETLNRLHDLYVKLFRQGGYLGLDFLNAVRAEHMTHLTHEHFPGLIFWEGAQACLRAPQGLVKPAYLDLPSSLFTDTVPEAVYLTGFEKGRPGCEAYFLLSALGTFQEIVTREGVARYAEALSQSRRLPKPLWIKGRPQESNPGWWLDDGYHRSVVISRQPRSEGTHRFVLGKLVRNEARPPLPQVPLEEIRLVTEAEYAQRARDMQGSSLMELLWVAERDDS